MVRESRYVKFPCLSFRAYGLHTTILQASATFAVFTNQTVRSSINVYIDIAIADMHISFTSSATSKLPTPLPCLLIILGLFLSCFPESGYEWTTWSDIMARWMVYSSPENADIRHYWDSLGASFLILGCFFSTKARRLLASPVCNFLGRVSFPVYLLHNTLLKSVFAWIIYLPSKMAKDGPLVNERNELVRGGWLQFSIGIPVYFVMLFSLAYLFTIYVDPLCAKVSKWIVSRLRADGGAEREKVTEAAEVLLPS